MCSLIECEYVKPSDVRADSLQIGFNLKMTNRAHTCIAYVCIHIYKQHNYVNRKVNMK